MEKLDTKIINGKEVKGKNIKFGSLEVFIREKNLVLRNDKVGACPARHNPSIAKNFQVLVKYYLAGLD